MAVGILIPVYNSEEYLRRCLDSVKAMDYADYRVILADDGSTDRSAQICEEYCRLDKRFSLIQAEHKGVSAARNKALAAAVSDEAVEWVTFVDADDYVEKDYLSYLLGLAHKTGSGFCACNHYIETRKGAWPAFETDRKIHGYSVRDALEHVLYHEKIDISCWGKLYARSLFEKMRFPEGMIFEDTWIFGEVLQAGGGIVVGTAPKYHYCYREHSLSKKAIRENKTDYIRAVRHLVNLALKTNPSLDKGCRRRLVHAALSVRRFFVDCEKARRPMRGKIDHLIRKHGIKVLADGRAPFRDKIGIVSLLFGDVCYDFCLKAYCKRKYE